MCNLLLLIKSALSQQPVYNRKRKACRENEAFIRAYQDYREEEVKNAPVLRVVEDTVDTGAVPSFKDIKSKHVKKKLITEENIGPSILSENTTVYGNLETTGNLRIDSRIEGDLSSAGSVIIGPKGRVHGKVNVRILELYGSVCGNCTVTEVLILRCASRLNGDVQARSVLVEKGAVFTGRASVGLQEEHTRADIAGPDRINDI